MYPHFFGNKINDHIQRKIQLTCCVLGLGAYLSSVSILRGFVRLLVDSLKVESPDTIIACIHASSLSFRCRMPVEVSVGVEIDSRVFRTMDLGSVLQVVSDPILVEDHARVRVRLDDGREGYVSIRVQDTFCLLQILPRDDADSSRWDIASAESTVVVNDKKSLKEAFVSFDCQSCTFTKHVTIDDDQNISAGHKLVSIDVDDEKLSAHDFQGEEEFQNWLDKVPAIATMINVTVVDTTIAEREIEGNLFSVENNGGLDNKMKQ